MTQVVFFIPPEVHMLDLSGPIQAFYAAWELNGDYKIGYCALHPETPDATGLTISRLPHYSEVDLREGDYLFLAGYNSKLLSESRYREDWERFYEWLRVQTDRKITICTVCLGAFILAEAGLLDGRKCTTHWSMIGKMKERYPRVQVLNDVLFVQDGNLFTSAGVVSGIDLALFLLERIHGPLFAHKVARELVVYSRRDGHHDQQSIYLNYRNHLHPGIHQLQDWLIDHLHIRMTIEKMAEMVNMSSRNLTRTFKQQTGISIHQYITLLRLEKARVLRNSPGITVSAIAGECGFGNERQLQRLWQREAIASGATT